MHYHSQLTCNDRLDHSPAPNDMICRIPTRVSGGTKGEVEEIVWKQLKASAAVFHTLFVPPAL